jgi:thiol-disulfide isomerase/thioredoxin
MKFRHLLPTPVLTALCLALGSLPAPAAEPAPAAAPQPAAPAAPEHPVSPAVAEVQALVSRINDKLKAGQQTEAALADELKAFAELMAKHAGEKTDEIAMIGVMKAQLYLEVLDNPEKGVALLRQVKADFPATKVAAKVDQVIARIEEKLAHDALLAVGHAFPDFNEKDLNGQPLSVSALKGKVVLVDFWATWCGPCVAELPNVIAAYQKYHGKGFEIVGVSLDKDQAKLTGFLKEHAMTWAQYFDGQGWQNKLAQQYGIEAIPATFLLDQQGNIVAKDLRGEALDRKLGELLK